MFVAHSCQHSHKCRVKMLRWQMVPFLLSRSLSLPLSLSLRFQINWTINANTKYKLFKWFIVTPLRSGTFAREQFFFDVVSFFCYHHRRRRRFFEASDRCRGREYDRARGKRTAQDGKTWMKEEKKTSNLLTPLVELSAHECDNCNNTNLNSWNASVGMAFIL